MRHTIRSVEDSLVVQGFIANRKLIAGLFFYFAALLVAMFALDRGTPTRDTLWSAGLLETFACIAAGTTSLLCSPKVALATTLGFATGVVFVVLGIAGALFVPSEADQHTLFCIALFVPLLYMAATLSMHHTLIVLSRAGAISIALLCLIALAHRPHFDGAAIVVLLILASQPMYFAVQKGLDTLQKVVVQTANETSTGKSVMLGMLSHELRTPLQTIRTSIDLLKLKAEASNQDTTPLDRIQRAASQLEAHLRDLVEFSNLESGLAEVEWIKFDLTDLLRGIADAYAHDAEARGNVIKVTTPHTVDWMIGDAVRVQQILNNLVSNAVKYTQDGVIELSAERLPADKGSVAISVRDTGMGIDPAKAENIWKPYLRLKNAKRAEGYGLGLAIVRMLVKMLGGTISLSSELGAGSTFTVTLPMRPA